jgi:hypothetical protein
MPDPTRCHLCDAPIAPGEHYVVRVDVFADPSMPEMTGAQLASTDFDAEMQRLIEQMKHATADELMDDVHRRFEYRVCRACQKQVLANPLGFPRRTRVGIN